MAATRDSPDSEACWTGPATLQSRTVQHELLHEALMTPESLQLSLPALDKASALFTRIARSTIFPLAMLATAPGGFSLLHTAGSLQAQDSYAFLRPIVSETLPYLACFTAITLWNAVMPPRSSSKCS